MRPAFAAPLSVSVVVAHLAGAQGSSPAA